MASPESKKLLTPQWSKLPPELLELISTKLTTVSSQVHFRGVCRSWRSAAKSAKLPPQLPLLILPTEIGATSTTRSFFSPYTGTTHSVDLPEAQGYGICASSAGWLVLINENHDSLLLNPLTRSTIRLPSPAGTFRKALKIARRDTVLHQFYICYAFMAPYAENQRECVVAFTKMNSFRFVYCRLGDAKWTEVRADVKCVLSFAYLKGKFYIMDMFGVVSVWDVSGDPMGNFVAASGLKMPRHCYLTTTDVDLLMVDRLSGGSDADGYELYRLDASGEGLRWERLRGLGDRKVFLVPGVPGSVVVSDAYGCRGNTVYFLSYSKTSPNQREIGAFDVENGSVERLPGRLDVTLGQRCESFVWFAPKFC